MEYSQYSISSSTDGNFTQYNNTIISLKDIHLFILLSKLIAFVSIMFLTVVGNGIVIIIILVNKHMRTTTYFYLLNLAVADVTIAVFNEWMWLHNHLTNNWMFGPFMCKISSFVQGVSVQVSIFTLTVVAGDRCFAIVYPLQSRVVKSSSALVILAIFIVWTIAIGLNIPLIFLTHYIPYTWDDGVSQHWCTEDREEKMIQTTYTLILFLLAYVVPLGIMLVAYVLIAKTLNSRGAGLECTTTAQDKSKRKVVKMLVVVVSTFALCWLPYHVYHLVRMLHLKDVNQTVEFGVLWLGYANSAMNPFIYCGFNENFRRGFRDTFQGTLFRRKKNIDFKSFKSQSCTPSDGTVMETTVI